MSIRGADLEAAAGTCGFSAILAGQHFAERRRAGHCDASRAQRLNTQVNSTLLIKELLSLECGDVLILLTVYLTAERMNTT